jgi:hypothetical protein
MPRSRIGASCSLSVRNSKPLDKRREFSSNAMVWTLSGEQLLSGKIINESRDESGSRFVAAAHTECICAILRLMSYEYDELVVAGFGVSFSMFNKLKVGGLLN